MSNFACNAEGHASSTSDLMVRDTASESFCAPLLSNALSSACLGDGQTIFTAVNVDGQVELHCPDEANPKLIGSTVAGAVCHSLSPCGQRLAVCDRRKLHLYEITNLGRDQCQLKLVISVDLRYEARQLLFFGSEGKAEDDTDQLLVCGPPGCELLTLMQEQTVLRMPLDCESGVTCATLAPQGSNLATALTSNIITIWDTTLWRRRYRFHARLDCMVTSMTFNPSGTRLAVASWKGDVLIVEKQGSQCDGQSWVVIAAFAAKCSLNVRRFATLTAWTSDSEVIVVSNHHSRPSITHLTTDDVSSQEELQAPTAGWTVRYEATVPSPQRFLQDTADPFQIIGLGTISGQDLILLAARRGPSHR